LNYGILNQGSGSATSTGLALLMYFLFSNT
jgi:hypothetical protein